MEESESWSEAAVKKQQKWSENPGNKGWREQGAGCDR